MHLKREVPTKAPRSPTGEILFGTKLAALVIGLLCGIPLGMVCLTATMMRDLRPPVVVTISPVTVTEDMSPDAISGADWSPADMTECRECHPESGKRLSLSDVVLCRTDDPSCGWSYGLGSDLLLRRYPTAAIRPFGVKRPKPRIIRLDRRDDPAPSRPFIDPLLYESF